MKPRRNPSSPVRKLWIALAVLAVLSPLGLALPKLFGAGGAWGEWSLDELRRLIGFLPSGMEKSGREWHAPLAGYAVPGQKGFFHESLGYVLSAVLGIAVVALAAWLLAKVFAGKSSGDGGKERGRGARGGS